MAWHQRWRPYVPVARRHAQGAAYAARLAKREGRTLCPVEIEGREIATSFWGRAWCRNLECYSDFANRLPRGRTYARNGSVLDVQIERGLVTAIVSGSEIYDVTIKIKTLAPAAWKQIKQDCARSIASLFDLLQGRFDQGIMQRLTQRDKGLFPQPQQIEMDCSCPDWAGMCKHVAAVLYGVGARLDKAPELLFTLRNVDHFDLIGQAVLAENLDRALDGGSDEALAESDLGELFGIDIETAKPRRKPAPRDAAKANTVKAVVSAESPAKGRKKARAKDRTARTDPPHKRGRARPKSAPAAAARTTRSHRAAK